MSQGELDAYIAKFEELAGIAGWGLEEMGTIDRFREGLPHGLQDAILNLERIPMTYADMKDGARLCHARWKFKKALLGPRTPFKQQEQAKWRGALTKGFKGKNKSKPKGWGDPMDVDAISINALEPEEKQRLLKEGRCFRCKDRGHQSRNCPKRSVQTPGNTGQAQKTTARATQLADDGTTVVSEAPPYNEPGPSTYEEKKAVAIRAISGMTKDERLAMIDECFEEDPDF